MQIVKNISELKNILKDNHKSIGFVPTMGALHNGHISLIQKAREQNDIVVLSIFVNPTQFLQGEDFDKYPNKLEADIKIAQLCDVDILFTPDINTMYSDDELMIKAPKLRGFILEGYNRPGHFDGVLQVVLKLFNIVNPTNAYFGKKDAQQLILIQQMIDNLFLDINIIQCDIVRDSDGLALSSRNVYLTPIQRELALKISQALREASNLIAKDIFNTNTIKKHIYKILDHQDIDIEYVSIVNQELVPLQNIELKNSIILIAVQIGTTRLIDNLWI
jgi:pantoate--beta-alanine ligase